jgi:hypothetical protein
VSSATSALFPHDLPGIFLKEIEGQKRPHDGLLHASSDLTGSLRHVMLRAVGAPSKSRSIASGIRLMHGTLWHEWFHQTLIKRGIPFFHELNLTDNMPEGWSGTADWVFWHPEYHAFILGDLKTAKGESLFWINKDGAKDEHIWQLSAYYYALLVMGLPMVKGAGVMYWPMNDTPDGDVIMPSVQEVEPLPEELVVGRMAERWAQTKLYATKVDETRQTAYDHGDEFGMDENSVENYLNDLLAPVQERIQKVVWSRPQGVFNLVLTPHWSARFCDFGPPLCTCSEQGTTKIGHYTLEGEFVSREGYEDVNPLVRPTPAQYKYKRKEVDG